MRGRLNKVRAADPTPQRIQPAYRPEADIPVVTVDLFAIVPVINEESLLERLKQLGADVYVPGEFPTLSDRLRHVIEREQWAKLVSGRDPQGKVETVGQAFERVTGQLLESDRSRNRARSNKEVTV